MIRTAIFFGLQVSHVAVLHARYGFTSFSSGLAVFICISLATILLFWQVLGHCVGIRLAHKRNSLIVYSFIILLSCILMLTSWALRSVSVLSGLALFFVASFGIYFATMQMLPQLNALALQVHSLPGSWFLRMR